MGPYLCLKVKSCILSFDRKRAGSIRTARLSPCILPEYHRVWTCIMPHDVILYRQRLAALGRVSPFVHDTGTILHERKTITWWIRRRKLVNWVRTTVIAPPQENLPHKFRFLRLPWPINRPLTKFLTHIVSFETTRWQNQWLSSLQVLFVLRDLPHEIERARIHHRLSHLSGLPFTSFLSLFHPVSRSYQKGGYPNNARTKYPTTCGSLSSGLRPILEVTW